MTAYIVGGGWLSAAGFGYLHDGSKPQFPPGKALLPSVQDVFQIPPSRIGRFDPFTRMGCFAAAMAIKDAGMEVPLAADKAGMVVSTQYECMETDSIYYQTTLESGGLYSSPNLFSYTLPNIVTGETAIAFKLTGPTFTLGESEDHGLGYAALDIALLMLQSDQADVMIAGWVDHPFKPLAQHRGEPTASGSVAVILAKNTDEQQADRTLHYDAKHGITRCNKPIISIIELFG